MKKEQHTTTLNQHSTWIRKFHLEPLIINLFTHEEGAIIRRRQTNIPQ